MNEAERDIWSLFAGWMFPNDTCTAMEVAQAPGGMLYKGAAMLKMPVDPCAVAANEEHYHA